MEGVYALYAYMPVLLLKWSLARQKVVKMLNKFRSRLGHLYSLSERKKAYQLTFCAPPGKMFVLPDLVEFCRASEPSPLESDLFIQGRAAGRRDVFLRIQQHLNLTEDELFCLYSGKSILNPKDFTNG